MSRFAPDWLTMRADRMPDEPALRTKTIRWTRSQLLDASDGLACALADAGVEPGDRVAALLHDDAPAVLLINAARRLGAVLVPLNRRASDAELSAQLDVSSASQLVFDQAHATRVDAIAGSGRSNLGVEALLAGTLCSVGPDLRDEVDLDGPAMIISTSGTTGPPKAAVLTHGNLAASAHAWAELLRPRPTDRWLACLPLFHVAGLATVTRAGRWGVELEVHPQFDPEDVDRALDEGVSHVSLVPAQLQAVLDARQTRPPPASLRAILLGGGPIPAKLLDRARRSGYPVLTTYGMTETASGLVAGGADPDTLLDVQAGRPLHRAEVRIKDPASDGFGEILVRGPMVFQGYLGEPAGSDERFEEGWFRTGDIGSLGPDGLLRISDRRSDLIISGGENVYPAQVEDVLTSHSAVGEAVVVGRRDERWGAVPVAFVVAADGARISPEGLQAFCRGRLAGYKVPAMIYVVDELPRDHLGKVRREELRHSLGEATV